jgi:adenine-specific DNA-methyltransferase
MPSLQWVGKDKVVNHHLDVSFQVLNKMSSFSALEEMLTDIINDRHLISGGQPESVFEQAWRQIDAG